VDDNDMVTVYVNEKESIEEALRRFSKLVEKEGIIAKAKENMYYIKPSKLRRDELNRARRKMERKRRKEQQKLY
jgi:small subunit ribosomal protein S21